MTEQSDWLEERRRHVTASEVGAILGHGYEGQNAFTVWDSKVNHKPFESNIIFDAGSALEDVAAKEYERISGRTLIDPGRFFLIEHESIEWLACTVDRLIFPNTEESIALGVNSWTPIPRNRLEPLEIKWMGLGSYVDREEWMADQPLRQQLQLQIQMSVLGAKTGVLLGCFLPGCNLIPAEKEYDAELFDALYPVLEKFWHCVRDRITPSPDDFSFDCKSIQRIYRTINRKTVKIDNPAQVLVVEGWNNARYARLSAEKHEAHMKAAVLQIIGENAFGALPDGSMIKRTLVKRGAYTVEPAEYIQLSYKERK